MHRAKDLVAVLGLSLVAMAVVSSQAFAAAGWMVHGTQLTGTAALSPGAILDEKLLVTGDSGQVEVKCGGSELRLGNPVISGGTGMADTSSWEVTECVGNRSCPLAESMGGRVQSLATLTDLTLDGALAVKGRFLSTNSSKLLGTIAFAGPECPFTGVQQITGAGTFLMPTGQDERTLQLIAMTDEEFGSVKLGSVGLVIQGSVLVHLTSDLPYGFL